MPRSITELYGEFEKALAAHQAMPEQPEEEWDRALQACNKMAHQIVTAPAVTAEEALLKIRVALWNSGRIICDRLDELDTWAPDENDQRSTPDLALLASLRDDLRRVQTAGSWNNSRVIWAGGMPAGHVAVSSYRVDFFKTLLNSEGHQFNCLQQSIALQETETPAQALEHACRRFEALHHVPDWRLVADKIEVVPELR
jgi:hypothetical protein